MVNIFFSYAKPNSDLVLRTYHDLARAHETRIWCYELDERSGYNFREQYLQAMEKADFFILFDSPAARASRYVQEETAQWQRLRKENPILFCLAVPFGAWHSEHQLVENQNELQFIDLTCYVQGIKNLHKTLGTVFIPSFSKPRDREFTDELAQLRPKLDAESYRLALQYYQFYYETHAYNPDMALGHLEVLIREINTISSLYMRSVLLTLADDYFVLKRFDSAIRVFREACKYYPQDPRGWAGLGFTQIKKESFSEAADSFQFSLQAIDNSDIASFREKRIEIVNALCGALIMAGKHEQALTIVASEIGNRYANAVTYGFGARLLAMNAELEKAQELLSTATSRVERQEYVDPAELIDLIDVARQIQDERALKVFSQTAISLYSDNPRLLRDVAAAKGNLGDREAALHYIEQAWKLDQKNLRIGAEFGYLLKESGRYAEIRNILESVLQSGSGTGEHAYYTGMAHYLLGRQECANYFLQLARHDVNVANWPDYND